MKVFYSIVAFIITSFSVQSQVDSLVAFYPFNGNAIEDLGSGIDGIINGAFLTNDRFGHQDSAFHFISDYPSFIDLGDSFDSLFTDVDVRFSFSFWIDPSDNMLNKAIISKYGNSNCNEDGREFLIRVSLDGRIEFINYKLLNSTNIKQGVKGNTPIIANLGWKHIAITYDGSIPSSNGLERIKIYVDGIQEVTSYSANDGDVVSMQDGPSHIGIGLPIDSNGDQCGDFAFDGKIDDIKLFKKVLTLYEVQDLFNEPDPMITSGLVSNLNSFQLKIFPNPVNNYVFLNNITEVDICIYDIIGNKIVEANKVSAQGELDLSSFINGTFILKVHDKDVNYSFLINILK